MRVVGFLVVVVVIVVHGACRDRASPSPTPPTPTPVVVADARPPAPSPAPRGDHEVDELGYGPIRVGEPTAELAALTGARLIEAHPIPQNYTRAGTVQRAGKTIVTLDIEAERETVVELAVTDPEASTREGIHVGTTVAELARVYGPPARTYERYYPSDICRQYAKAPGIDFCGDQTLERFRVPARHFEQLALGEDLAAIASRLDGHMIYGEPLHAGQLGTHDAALVAPCLLATYDDHDHFHGDARAVIAQAGAVFDLEAGWRRTDGSIVICTGTTSATDASVYEIDPSGHGTRWVFVQENYFRREPAECKSVPAGANSLASITCRGATDRELGFAGDQIDALSGTFFVPSTLQSDGGGGPEQRERTAALATRRAIRSDGAAVDACDRRLAQHWEASVRARGALGLPTDDAARLSYLDSGSAHAFIGGCLAPAGAEFPTAPPAIDYRPVRPQLAAFSAVERHARERELVGTWLQQHSYFTDEWTFTAAEQIDRYGHHAYRFPRPHELVIGPDYPPHASRIVRDTADRMFIADSGIDCPPDLAHAEIPLGMDLLLIRGAACTVITRTDRLATTSCTRDGRKLSLHYVDDDGHDKQLGFEQVDGCYVQDSVAPFVRRVQ